MKAQYKIVFEIDDCGDKRIVISEKHSAFLTTWWLCIHITIYRVNESEFETTKRATDKLAEIINNRRKNSSWVTQKPIYFTAEGERL